MTSEGTVPLPEREIGRATFTDFALPTLERLLATAGLPTDDAVTATEAMLGSWGQRPIGERPAWYSDVCADDSPLEFSAVFTPNGVQEVRISAEAIPDDPGAHALQTAATELTHAIARQPGVSLERLHAVWDLFMPDTEPLGFSMVYSAVFRTHGKPLFKVYVNPAVSNAVSAEERALMALERWGVPQARDTVTAYARRGPELDPIVLLSLDLAETSDARIKVYFRHYGLTAAQLDDLMAIAPGHRPGSVEAFARAVSGHTGRFEPQPPVTNLTFTTRGGAVPVSATADVPLWTYGPHDKDTQDRVAGALVRLGIPPGPYRALLAAVARRPLGQGRGIHTYTSLRVHRAGPRVTVYWSPEFYDRFPPACYQR
ncbi:tryptophan dimethylallyltransferase family protein [Streptomyces sp. NPDC002564]|uniref:tryptophan dimethylallyltransferase family protein n=1 Tax=Streptomyces sp. NPDC002564 TaxID=3364649 RepID=UPI00369B6573